MDRMIFVNLPVSDVEASTAFYTGLGFSKNPQFSDEVTSCIVVSDTICVMIMEKSRFADFVVGPIADPRAGTSAINCLSAESRSEVDDLLAKAQAGGGKPWKDMMDEGPMYGGSFADPDGHVWEILYMDMSHVG